MEAGAALFEADLATRAFTGARCFPFATPIDGSAMILSWLALAAAFALAASRKEARRKIDEGGARARRL